MRFASPAEATCRLGGSELWRRRGFECLMIGGFFVWFLDCFYWKTMNAIISELSQKSLPKSSPGDPQTGPGDSPESSKSLLGALRERFRKGKSHGGSAGRSGDPSWANSGSPLGPKKTPKIVFFLKKTSQEVFIYRFLQRASFFSIFRSMFGRFWMKI